MALERQENRFGKDLLNASLRENNDLCKRNAALQAALAQVDDVLTATHVPLWNNDYTTALGTLMKRGKP